MMSSRRVDVRRGMTAGLGMAIFFTILSTAQAPPQDRVTAFALTAIGCAVGLSLMFLVLRAVQSRRHG